jgi:hypothetical protein
MNEDMNFPALEERLQTEAKRLLTAEQGLSASRLADLYRRRQRRRRAAQVSAGAAVVLVALAVRFGGPRKETANAPAVPERATVAKLERGTAADGHGADAPAVQPRLTGAEWPDNAVFAIPFVIGDPAAGDDVITGIYVPEQVEPIDVLNLSPAERDAVRAVLGIDGEDTDVIQAI